MDDQLIAVCRDRNYDSQSTFCFFVNMTFFCKFSFIIVQFMKIFLKLVDSFDVRSRFALCSLYVPNVPILCRVNQKSILEFKCQVKSFIKMMKFKSTTEKNSNSQKKNRNINRLHYAKPTNFREKSS